MTQYTDVRRLGSVKAIRLMTLPREKRIDSVRRHQEWQDTLNKDAFLMRCLLNRAGNKMMILMLLRIGRQTVSLPISAKLTDDEVQNVIAAVFRVLGKVEATGGSVMADKIPLLRLSKPRTPSGLKALVNALARPVDQGDGIEFDGCGVFVKHCGCL